jgi:hypothetical protein
MEKLQAGQVVSDHYPHNFNRHRYRYYANAGNAGILGDPSNSYPMANSPTGMLLPALPAFGEK